MMAVTSAALRFCHFQVVRRMLIGYARMMSKIARPVEPETIVREVERSLGGFRTQGTCLAAALTAEALFTQHGYDSVFCIGARRNSGRFEAHAWIERDDRVVVGGPKELTLEYTRFPGIPV